MAQLETFPRITLFNTASRELEEFAPLSPGSVRLYCCGPTVYNFQHIGNLRAYLVHDLLVRTLRYAGYTVTHVMNITDVGHLVTDADEGDDKMAIASRREGRSSREIAEYYSGVFFEDCRKLNIGRPDVVCKATDHIPEMIALIQRLEKKGIAYRSGGNVYFDVDKFPSYGDFARLKLDAQQAGSRVGVDHQKRGEHDFALWFTRSKFENQELQWESPWGTGYPGWHIECSAMSMKYLGEQFDIHCGGIDHIPVHHTNEIAQSEGATGKKFVRYWIHNAFLVTAEKEKMSKSAGEFLTMAKLEERGHDPLSYRMLCLGAGYRSELAWSWEALRSAEKSLERLRTAVFSWSTEGVPATRRPEAEAFRTAFREAIFHDLGVPRALAVVYELIGDTTLTGGEKRALMAEFDQILGLDLLSWKPEEVEIPKEVEELAARRDAARKEKRWKDADSLRDQIASLGFTVEDSSTGPNIKRIPR